MSRLDTIKHSFPNMALLCFVIQGCAYTNNYVSEKYPEGNDDLSRAALNACSNEVPYATAQAAEGTVETKYHLVANPLTGQSDFMPVEAPVCNAKCKNARAWKAKHISKCMEGRGWWLKSP